MKALLLTLVISSVSLAKPFFIEGTWEKANHVLPMARIHYVVLDHVSETEQFKQLGYSCRPVQGRELCHKSANRNFELPIEVKARLWELAYNSISFSRSTDSYIVVNDSENSKMWTRDQSIEIDKLRFEKLTWLENSDKNGTVKKVVLSSNRHDEKVDLVVLNPTSLGVVVKIKVGNLKGWNEYWGIVQYKP